MADDPCPHCGAKSDPEVTICGFKVLVHKKDCPNALNLDGGGSTQISALVDGFEWNIEGYTAVPNALAVQPLSTYSGWRGRRQGGAAWAIITLLPQL